MPHVLTYLYPALTHSVKKKDLDLCKNRLSGLPDSFSSLVALENLRLDDNLFLKVPAPISSLICLKYFSADRNGITDISSLLQCASLETIIVQMQMPIDLPLRLPKLRSYKVGESRL